MKNEGGDQGSSNNAALLHSFLFWSLVVLMGPRPREIFSYLQSECLLNTECFNDPWVDCFKPKNVQRISKSIVICKTHGRCQFIIGSKNWLKHNMIAGLTAFFKKKQR